MHLIKKVTQLLNRPTKFKIGDMSTEKKYRLWQ